MHSEVNPKFEALLKSLGIDPEDQKRAQEIHRDFLAASDGDQAAAERISIGKRERSAQLAESYSPGDALGYIDHPWYARLWGKLQGKQIPRREVNWANREQGHTRTDLSFAELNAARVMLGDMPDIRSQETQGEQWSQELTEFTQGERWLAARLSGDPLPDCEPVLPSSGAVGRPVTEGVTETGKLPEARYGDNEEEDR